MRDEVPNRPDDISAEIWEQAYDTNHALWAVCDNDPDDVKFWQDTKVIAKAITQAHSQAFEEASKIADDNMNPGPKDAAQAIRQHSQKGRDA